MITTIELAKVKLNPTDTLKPSIIISNDEGVLIVDKSLFSLSFDSEKDMLENIEVTNRHGKYIVNL